MSNPATFPMKKNNTSIDLLESRVLYEDNHLIIINKLPSEIVQGDKTGDVPLSEYVEQYLKAKYNKPGNVFVGVTHRLDRPVSGIVMFAKTSKALSRLNAMFNEKKIVKHYWAVVKEKPPQEKATLIQYLTRNEKMNKSFISDITKPGAKQASLRYELLGNADNYYLLQVQLHTGRHHQIRSQLAFMGCPIKGDLKYGFPRSNPDASIHLHAVSIAFEHPIKKEFLYQIAKPPDEALWNYFFSTFKSKLKPSNQTTG